MRGHGTSDNATSTARARTACGLGVVMVGLLGMKGHPNGVALPDERPASGGASGACPDLLTGVEHDFLFGPKVVMLTENPNQHRQVGAVECIAVFVYRPTRNATQVAGRCSIPERDSLRIYLS
jgi:hypothetical protein